MFPRHIRYVDSSTWRIYFVNCLRHGSGGLYRLRRGNEMAILFPKDMASQRTKTRRLQLKGERIPYTVRRSHRARRVSLTMQYDGSIVVSAPEKTGLSEIERFIMEKSAWVLKNFLYFKTFKGKIFTGDKKEFFAHKERAARCVTRRLARFNKVSAFRVNRVSIKHQRAQWGSCSDKKNLNFNYKILFLPSRLRDYVIVHELCHTRELNHSARFWRLVGEIIPHYEHRESELRNYRIG